LSVTKWLVVVVVAVLVAAFFAFDLDAYLTLASLQSGRGAVVAWVAERPVAASASFFAVYVVVTALSLPGAAVMTLAAGAVFGVLWGLALVSFASSLGATLAFLLSRTLLRDWVQRRFGDRLEPINRGFERDGNFFLFGLRMVPVFPFFVVNLVMGLTPMRVLPFYVVSQVGMFAGTLVYVFAGTQLAQVASLRDVMSPGLVLALSLLGLFPLVARKLLAAIGARRSGATT
jgi:uncharacterized membrane protein YdjX (TVP38/TMEM64 family)